MPGDSEFFPPAQFSPLWMLLGLGILLAIVAWFVLVAVATRATKPAVEEAPVVRDVATARMRYLALIAEVEAAHGRFELSAREAHQRLSGLVRAFAHETGVHPTSAMTLSELKQLDLPELSGAVERMYPAEFGVHERGNLSNAVAEARKVVQEWR